ncbi:hypothetical protein, partial [Burkholderia pseudomallei]|uniref:hypothetical protein n=1 Tax=Burkholderia pseudomallei TaxID=28450 RepID=UPI0035A1074D
MCDDAGRISVTLRGLTSRPLARRTAPAPEAGNPAGEVGEVADATDADAAEVREISDVSDVSNVSNVSNVSDVSDVAPLADGDVGLLARTAVWSALTPAQWLADPASRPRAGARVFVLGGTAAQRREIARIHPGCEPLEANAADDGGDGADQQAHVDALRRRLAEGAPIDQLVWIA